MNQSNILHKGTDLQQIGKSFYLKKSKKCKISYIHHIKPEDFLTYYNLIGSIPVRKKNEIKQQLPVNLENMQLHNKIREIKKGNKLLYEIQLKRNNSLTMAEEKWGKLFGQNVNWKSVYTIPDEITVDTNLRCFQYKL